MLTAAATAYLVLVLVVGWVLVIDAVALFDKQSRR
jgi:hypothetical protein